MNIVLFREDQHRVSFNYHDVDLMARITNWCLGQEFKDMIDVTCEIACQVRLMAASLNVDESVLLALAGRLDDLYYGDLTDAERSIISETSGPDAGETRAGLDNDPAPDPQGSEDEGGSEPERHRPADCPRAQPDRRGIPLIESGGYQEVGEQRGSDQDGAGNQKGKQEERGPCMGSVRLREIELCTELLRLLLAEDKADGGSSTFIAGLYDSLGKVTKTLLATTTALKGAEKRLNEIPHNYQHTPFKEIREAIAMAERILG